MSSSVASSSSSSIPSSNLPERDPTVAQLLGRLRQFESVYAPNSSNSNSNQASVWASLHQNWWRVVWHVRGRVTATADETSRMTNWPLFLGRQMSSINLRLHALAVFDPVLTTIKANASLQTRFRRVAKLLGTSDQEVVLELGPIVCQSTNTLKMLASLMSPASQEPHHSVANVLRAVRDAMVARHQDPNAAPVPTVTDVACAVASLRPNAAASRRDRRSRSSSLQACSTVASPTPLPSIEEEDADDKQAERNDKGKAMAKERDGKQDEGSALGESTRGKKRAAPDGSPSPERRHVRPRPSSASTLESGRAAVSPTPEQIPAFLLDDASQVNENNGEDEDTDDHNIATYVDLCRQILSAAPPASNRPEDQKLLGALAGLRAVCDAAIREADAAGR